MDIKDYLHLYLGCEVMPNDIPDITYKLFSVHYNDDVVLVKEDWHLFSFEKYRFSEIKPILRPLSDMTTGEKFKFNPKNEDGEIGQEFMGSESETPYAFVSFTDMARTINQLRALGFDCDGLIEAGLAIDATTLTPTH
jgi:hypothetical protein